MKSGIWQSIRAHRAILVLLGLFSLAKIPSLTLPFWWDEAGAYVYPSFLVAETGLWRALPGGHPKGFLHGHPPVLYLIHGTLYRIFGSSILPHHIAALVFALVGLWFTYRLGCVLWSGSTGLCAAIILACTPMFFAQSSMVMGDLAIASLGVASIYYLMTERLFAYAIVGTLMLQTKETALAISVAAVLYDFFVRKKTVSWWRVLIHAVPIGSLAAFFAIEYIATGSFVQAPYFNNKKLLIFDLSNPAKAIAEIVEQGRWVGAVLFYQEGRFLLTAVLILGVLLHSRKTLKEESVLFGLVTALYWSAFSLIGFLPRYVMPVLPYLCVAAASAVYVSVWKREVAQYAVTAGLAIAFVPFFYINSASGNFETNMRHEQAVALCRRVGMYIEMMDRPPTLLADFPLTMYLSQPVLGYVATPARGIVNTSSVNVGELNRPSVFVYFSIGPSNQSDTLRRAIGKPPLRRFEEKGGMFAEIYELSAPVRL